MELERGLREFQLGHFQQNREFYRELEKGQTPKTLFIGCSDSRVVPNLITTTFPEELFVVRNIANFVPPYDPHRWRCTTAILEYGVQFLEVENILVCGHSDCGGLKALYYPREQLAQFPAVEEWLSLGEELKRRFSHLPEPERKRETELANVVLQLERLKEYPFIAQRVKEGRLRLIGWYYEIGTGRVLSYNWERGEFEELKGEQEGE